VAALPHERVYMVVTLLALAVVGSAYADVRPVVNGSFLNRLTASELIGELEGRHVAADLQNSSLDVVPLTGSVLTELAKAKHWVRTIMTPAYAEPLANANWTAYRNLTHRYDPLIAEAVVDGNRIVWLDGDRDIEVYMELANPVAMNHESFDAILYRVTRMPVTEIEPLKDFFCFDDRAGGFAFGSLERQILPTFPEGRLLGILPQHWRPGVIRQDSPCGGYPLLNRWDGFFPYATDGKRFLFRVLKTDDLHPIPDVWENDGPTVYDRSWSRFD
jgi:hypothetical protein